MVNKRQVLFLVLLVAFVFGAVRFILRQEWWLLGLLCLMLLVFAFTALFAFFGLVKGVR